MRLKSYFADTVEAAMSLAARELGDDALLVYSREAAAETKYLGNYEVVFAAGQGAAGQDASAAAQAPQAVPPATGIASVPSTSLAITPRLVLPESGPQQFAWASMALAELKNEIGSLREDVASHRRCMEELLTASDRRAWRLLADWGSEPELLPGVALAGRLLQTDMDPEHVLEVIENTRDAVRHQGLPDGGVGTTETTASSASWRLALERELTTRRSCDARPGPTGDAQAIVLIGPPGAGRTTVAMQLTAVAAARSLEPRLIAFEPARLSAAQALRSYAGVLGAPFELARRADHIAGLLAGGSHTGLTIVDGPGLGLLAEDAAVQLKSLCRQVPHLETWLVLPATLRASDLRILIERFAAYGPARLIFTRTAEARHWGSVWSAAEWAGIPLGFFCDGPRIPEDLRPATAEYVAGAILYPATLQPGETPDIKTDRWTLERTLAAGQN